MRTSLSSVFLEVTLTACLALGVGACEKVDHENIDKWGHTEKGPGKLLDALESGEHGADLRAHAAQALIGIERFTDVRDILEALEEEPRQKIMASLAGRLWEVARINDHMAVPTARQSNAKDALFNLMDFADAPTGAKIADYLVEWFLGGHYEGRARAGRISGAMAIRRVGVAASTRLLQSAHGILAKPADEQGRREQVGDELLRALALCGSPAALDLLLDLLAKPRGDVSLPGRIMGALNFAFVEPVGFEAVDGKALLAIKERLDPMPYDNSISGTMRNDAVALLAAIGAPECIPIFTKMISYPTDEERFRWMGTQQGMRCAGVQGAAAITEALPASVDYQRGMLSKYLWDEILKYDDPKRIGMAATHLLGSQSPVARITGIELFGELGAAAATSENIQLIRGLSGDKHRLKRWWGDQSESPKAEREAEPTIGDRASDVAKSLEALASQPSSK
ncbi:MAG: hypothetical protein GY811_19740 [Myxococcales bacterium]|nr:hypothetical protein [Myxococcales bacterium]